ncbi:hypothetical protein B0H15DRAFT_957092 [Mycena belliarum]|uniref:Uncharacterized protein n=1 Tax=Mycena belliarum TaxID=1033014 RepID=A0AAD6XIT3_9AGAR|nr:hypothetical protein B0H15DRAFT_957092 [Mycena belliae]
MWGGRCSTRPPPTAAGIDASSSSARRCRVPGAAREHAAQRTGADVLVRLQQRRGRTPEPAGAAAPAGHATHSLNTGLRAPLLLCPPAPVRPPLPRLAPCLGLRTGAHPATPNRAFYLQLLFIVIPFPPPPSGFPCTLPLPPRAVPSSPPCFRFRGPASQRGGTDTALPSGPPSPLCALTTSALFVPVAPLHAPHRQRLQHPPSAAAGPALLSASPLYRRSSTTAHRRSPVLGVLRRGVLLYLHHAVLPSMPRPAAATPFAPPPFAPPPLARSPRRRSPRRRAPRMFGRFGVHTSPLPSPSFRARRRSPRSPLAPGFTALGPLGSLHAGRQAGISSPSF